jgi:hypothetical protein
VQLTAVFETWHIGDGNYPPLRKGQLVNLSFELEPHSLSKSTFLKDSKFEQIKDADYSFAGMVLRSTPILLAVASSSSKLGISASI